MNQGLATANSVSTAEEEWKPVETAYLKQLKASHRARARAAMRWRPRFESSGDVMQRHRGVESGACVLQHSPSPERSDPEFAAQIKEAESAGADLLHYVCWKAAVEGNLEPVYFQGEVVGHIREHDTTMQIEMLRAHMPELFKTPGARVSVNAQPSVSNNLTIIDEAARNSLVELRQEALRALAAGRDARAVPATVDHAR